MRRENLARILIIEVVRKSVSKIVALFCRPTRQLLAIHYNSSVKNLQLLIYLAPRCFHCRVQILKFSLSVFNMAVISNIKYILRYNVSTSSPQPTTFATVESFDKHICKI